MYVHCLRDIDSMKRLHLLFTLILFLFALSMVDPALAAPSMDPELQEIYKLTDRRRFPQALVKLRSFLQKNPKNDEARFLLGLILTEQKKRKQAIAVFTQLTKEHPEYPEPFNNLAVLYADQGQYEKARRALLQALATHPSYATAQENLGDIYAKMAAHAYRKALQQQRKGGQKGMAKAKLALITRLFDTSTPAVAARSSAPAPQRTAASAPVTTRQPPPTPSRRTAPPPSRKRQLQELQQLINKGVEEKVLAWAHSWSQQDVNGYLSFYSRQFRPKGGVSLSAWKKKRRWILRRPSYIQVSISNLKVRIINERKVRVTFRQKYRSDRFNDTTRKTLVMGKEAGGWKILREMAHGS